MLTCFLTKIFSMKWQVNAEFVSNRMMIWRSSRTSASARGQWHLCTKNAWYSGSKLGKPKLVNCARNLTLRDNSSLGRNYSVLLSMITSISPVEKISSSIFYYQHYAVVSISVASSQSLPISGRECSKSSLNSGCFSNVKKSSNINNLLPSWWR